MNKQLLPIICLMLLMTACGDDKKKTLAESSIHAKVDSIVGVKMEELNRQAMEDLDHRMAIEVKAKADSIVGAKTGKIDTTKKPVAPPVRVTRQTIFHKK